MKLTLTDATIAVREIVTRAVGDARFSIDHELFQDHSDHNSGKLYRQNQPFFVFETIPVTSRRVGPTTVAPTRYFYDLEIGYLVKSLEYDPINDARMLEELASKIAEQTFRGVRFRTYTPYRPRKDNGFTHYSGVIAYDFELYRGD